MGRHPLAPALRVVTGNRGKRRIKATPGARIADAHAEPPAHLNEEAKAIWNETLPRLVADRLIGALDLNTLAAYCEATATVRESCRALLTEGHTTSGPHGPIVSPWIKVRTDATTRAWKAAAVLGIGQLNRQRLHAIPDEVKVNDPEERFFSKVDGR